MASALELMCWKFFLILKGLHPRFLFKNISLPLESKLLVMWEGIGEALQIVSEMVHNV
jgi:hypothetical protein